jgi:hypothetical protein
MVHKVGKVVAAVAQWESLVMEGGGSIVVDPGE